MKSRLAARPGARARRAIRCYRFSGGTPMRDSWLDLVDRLLRPARPDLARCLRERARHLAARRLLAEERARMLAAYENAIEQERAAVFAANDGVISSRMTALERAWRATSRPDPEGGLMDLWA